MDRLDLVRRIIEQGSDTLVAGLHQRLCADRMARAPAAPIPEERRPPPSWEELAGQAVGEHVLAPDEAQSLAPGGAPALPAPGHRVIARDRTDSRTPASPEAPGA